MKTIFHHIVRGIVIKDEQLLIANFKENHSFFTRRSSAPKRKQGSMNRCLVEIGVRFPEYTEMCMNIGEKIGKLNNKPVPKGCTSSYAPEWITVAMNRKKN